MDFFLIAFSASLYFLPTIVAVMRDHNNAMPIFLVNLLFGWAYGIGWVIALIWACTNNTKKALEKNAAKRAEAIAVAVNKALKEKETTNKARMPQIPNISGQKQFRRLTPHTKIGNREKPLLCGRL